MYISEFLANPNGVSDANGEWVELYNAGPDTANLKGWQLKDLGSDSHTIAGDLLIAPGAYVVLARNSDSTANGGISAAYRYTKFTLGNDDDEILLLRPDGSEEDRIVWGGTSGLSIRAGESFERTAFNGSAWVPATTVWPGSAGDLGTPGSGYAAPVSTATPTATPTATTDDGPRTATAMPTPTATTDDGPPTATPTPTPTATTDSGPLTATPTVTPTATTDDGPPTAAPTVTSTATTDGGPPTASAMPTPTANDGGNGSVFISEFLADPSAVADADGEWIELYNAGPDGVNLRGWTIADLDSDSHTIASDLFLAAGGYVVLARNSDFAENGGVRVDYVYSGVTLANSADEILLLRPNGTEEDRVVWGSGSGLNISRGDSLERTNFVTPIWVAAISAWPNSLGDFGTPGSGFVPPSATGTPTPTATADRGPRTATPTVSATPTATLTPTTDGGPLTATPTVSATPTATLTPTADGGPLTATSTATPTPTATMGDEANASVFISEFLADPSAVSDANGEWIELHNAGPDPVNLKGWMIADLDSDSHTIAADLFVGAGGYVVLGRNGDSLENGGVSVDYVYSGVSLANSADEILLLRPNGTEEDRVVWGGGSWRVTTGKSLERITFGPVPVWLTAGAAWPGSAGDFGTPGRGFVPPSATGTPTATATADRGPRTATPTVSATPTATLTPTADGGPPTATPTATLTPTADDGPPTATPTATLTPTADGGPLTATPTATLTPTTDGGPRTATPTVSATPTATLTPTADGGLLTATPTATLTPTADGGPPTATSTATPTPTATIGGEANASVFISEFLADPSAVSDANGEWLELHNAGPDSVNLKGWTLADLDSDSHTIASDLFVGAGGYVVLARNAETDENGGVSVDYVYSGVTLANSADEILLLSPDGAEEDRVVWGGGSWRVTPGKSLERITFGPVPVWLTAGAAWPGSAGDFGTPGRGFVPPSATGTPTPTPTATADGGPPTATPTITATPTATLTPTADDGPPTATPTATPTPTATIGGEANASVFISEFLADPSAVSDANGEWIELYNAGPDPVNLKGWTIADLDSDNHTIAADLFVAAEGYVVLGRNGDSLENGGVTLQYIYSGMTLANSADEILLLRPDGTEEDRVVWGGDAAWRVTPGRSLERITFGPVPVWLTAGAAWSGSAGDFGTPGQGFVPPSATGTPTPTATATTDSGPRTATPTVSATPTATLTPTADGGPLTATSTATPTPTATIGGEANVSVFISEFLADPSAVSDANGEWIELYNAGPDPVNLSNWVLADLSRDRHVITDEIVVAPDAYVVLARKSDPSANGGVVADYVYSGVNLANDEDEILLLRPDGREEDRVVWGGSSDLRPERGKSLERTGFGPLAQWVVAASAWPGSAGDFGSPGSGFVPPVGTATPTPTVTPTATPTVDGGAQTATVTATATPSAAVTPTPSATSVILPILWPPVTEPALLRIDEVNFQGSDLEFVVLVNVGDSPLNLTGWVVGDGATPGGGEGLYALPEGQLLAPHAPFVIARNAAAFHTHWGRPPDAQFEESESSVPVLERRRELASGRLALNDSGDEVLLLDPSLALADGVVWGSGDGAGLGLTGTLDRITDRSLQRVPGYVFPTERDPRHRFLWAAPAPFASVVLPERAVVPGPSLADGLQAVWGSLAAASNFTPGGAAPPHYVQAAGANVGLGFVAVADPPEAIRQRSVEDQLAAWRWTGSDGGGAIVYGPPFATDGTTGDFLAGLASSGGLAQWLPSGVPPGSAEVVVALAADGLTVPGGLPNFSSRWESGPRLPAGNAQPPVAGAAEPNPRYTGLAAADTTEAGLLEALAARRGWLTNRPGLALTLRAHTADGIRWMGSAIEPQDALAVEIDYHDWNSHVAGLALWLNDRPIAQTDLPQGNGVWQTIVSAAPGSVLYAVATQADGDFAVTAPLLVGNGDGARVVINEVLPAPAADWNGDGTIDSNDEFIELYNPGETPVSLAGWRLEDRSNSTSARRRFVLGVEHLLPAGGFLAIWGRDSHIGLNDDGDRVELYDSSDRLVDGMEWNSRMERGKSLSRVPNGGNWQSREPSPGRANPDDAPGAGGSGEPPESLPPWGSGAAPGTPGGEAVGPFRSVTAAKLAGMEDGVQFIGVVTVPPGLFNSVIYVADPALPPNDATAWLGVQVYLRRGDFPPLVEGDRVEIRGTMHSFRGEREILVERPEDIWRVGPGELLQPLAIDAGDVGEPLEGRLVTFEGIVTGWLGVSIFLADPAQPDAEPVMVTVRSSLGWRRPYVNKGERWQVTGIVSQSAAAAPWNGGYRVLVRYPQDLSEK